MAKKPNLRLKRNFTVVAHSADVVELRHGVWNPVSFTLRDETESGVLFELLSQLDGTASPGELAKRVGVAEGDVQALLDHLVQLGAVEAGPTNALDYYLDTVVPLFRGPAGPTPADRAPLLLGDAALRAEIHRHLAPSLPESDVSSVGDDDPAMRVLAEADASWLTGGLELQRKVTAFASWRERFLVVAMKVIDPLRLHMVNRVCLELGTPWIHAALDGPFLLVGPVVVPHRSACYECFETRVAMNLREGASYQQYKRALAHGQVRHGSVPLEPVLTGLLGSLTTFESLNFLLTRTTFTVGKVLAVYLPTMEIAFNEILRVPGCPACGSVPERDEQQLYFDARAFLGGGT